MIRPLCIIETRQVIDLCTDFVYPPIPTRSMDWQAYDRNTYDCDYHEGHWRCGISGSGRTEWDATNDLIDQLIEQAS